MGYLTVNDIVSEDFLKKPGKVIVEAGNGFGKTHSMAEFVYFIQPMKRFERIYFLEYSQRGCENVVNKITARGGKVIWHIGIEHHCPNTKLLNEVRELGIPISYACYLCRYFRAKQRLAFIVFREMVEDPAVRVVKPVVKRRGLERGSEVCIQPILRAYVLTPSFELDYRAKIKYTPVIVAPSQLLLNHVTIGRWYRYARRQRKDRRNLMIIDEADTVFYSSLNIEVPDLQLDEVDRRILEMFSSKRRDLTKLIDLYHELRRVLKDIVDNLGFVRHEHVHAFRDIIERASKLVSSFEYRRKDIVQYVLSNKVSTRVFRLASLFSELTHVENVETTLASTEMSGDKFVLQDFDFGVKCLLDTSFPWRYFWKVLLSATFPTDKIVESRFLSIKAKSLLSMCEKKTKTYSNVYVSTVEIFPQDYELLNRNYEIEFAIPKIVSAIKRCVKRYQQLFKIKPGGVCLWLGNKKQASIVIRRFRDIGLKLRIRKNYAIATTPLAEIFISYVGSAVARGIDLDRYDISIAVAPLLRPPRNLVFLDVVDFARAVSETIQSVMRIVRSPSPPRPKLVVIERSMTKTFYTFFYPDWFKVLVANSFIEV